MLAVLYACLVASFAFPADVAAQGSEAFPHSRHAKLFPTCSGCHAGITTNDAARSMPAVGSCASCHDGVIQKRVTWTPPARRGPGLLVFSHATHASRAKDVSCESCHAKGAPTEWLNVAQAAQGRCASCHAHQAAEHYADDNTCTTCHRPLIAATSLSDARVAALPQPPSHARAGFTNDHGPAATAALANCATCHARQSCERCHVNASSSRVIQALGSDARVARAVAGKPAVYPTPSDHRATEFVLVHGRSARAEPGRCATCHARASCETCHTGDGARDVLRLIPAARDASAPGVQLRRAPPVEPLAGPLVYGGSAVVASRQAPPQQADTIHRVRVHPKGFVANHGPTAASGAQQCASCHAQRYCSDCHAGERVSRSYHPANFVSTHAPQAYGRDTDCSACHTREAFCRDCHRQTGFAAKANARSAVFHNAQPLWLIQHGRAARQDLTSCTTCHQQTYCMQCHSDVGSRINPHGPTFNAAAMSARNPQLCLTCHFKNPLGRK
jgi:hypothetical protein